MHVKSELAKAGQDKTALTEADPQAAMLAKIVNLVFAGVKVDDVQMGLTIFIALLLEVGSSFGMYIAFSQWRLHDAMALPAQPSAAAVGHAAVPAPVFVPVAANAEPVPVPLQVPLPVVAKAPEALPAVIPEAIPSEVPAAATVQAIAAAPPAPAMIAAPVTTANDNTDKVSPVQRMVAPESDVERFQKEKIENEDGATITATELYDSYCQWCEEQDKEPLALPTFSREFGELKGIKKAKIAGRVRYLGIAVNGTAETTEDKKSAVPVVRAA